ncbi:hypothetical protein NQ315_005522 [Exocentrus adspersus]|uniref:Pentraxin (PTX) domain-containing protein n=1 Tax=Exocentrus adspersus TaxID=1586481 RepID=A0AAV8VTL5_9CUCU|nr:hypothetical protein NQ315_005522 [Exocentrus adspersus]
MYKYLGLLLVLTSSATGIHEPDAWHPFQQADIFQSVKVPFHAAPSSLSGLIDQGYNHDDAGDQCQIHKVAFTQDLYFQYIQYKTNIPDTKQFTLCFWSKFYNHSNDHPIFSYAMVDGQPRAIVSMVSNTERSSYFSLAVEGHTFYRLNYPLRLNRWYHTCQSWNGKTGEWQIWVNAERVGRGFHNRLVGHVIPGGGIAITGQEQSQLGGGFQEGKDAPKGSGGMLGEITMVQLYKVALTAGKAHKDHKHHHAHKYDHEGRIITTPAPTTPRVVPRVHMHPLLTGGQINRNLKINFAGGQPQVVPGQNYNAQYLNGQFVGSLVTRQLTQAQGGPQKYGFQPQTPQQPLINSNSFSNQFLSVGDAALLNTGLDHDSQVQYIDNSQSVLEAHNLFKRQEKGTAQPGTKFGDKVVKKRESGETKHKKRELYLGGGTIFEDQFIGKPTSTYDFDQSLLYGLAGIGQNQVISQQQKQTEDEREPAEAEVKAVMNVCSGCDPEPFDKALVFGWRTVSKKLYSGAFYAPAVSECRAF